MEDMKHRIVYEDRFCYAVLNKYPASKGHLLVISKKHHKDILSTDTKTLDDCFEVAKRLSSHVERALNARGVKLIVNIGHAVELTHTHIHVIPIYNREPRIMGVSYKNRRMMRKKEREELLKKLSYSR